MTYAIPSAHELDAELDDGQEVGTLTDADIVVSGRTQPSDDLGVHDTDPSITSGFDRTLTNKDWRLSTTDPGVDEDLRLDG